MKKKEAALNLLVEVFSHKEWGLCKIVQMNRREAIVQEFGKTKIIRHPIPYGRINDNWVPEIKETLTPLPPDELLTDKNLKINPYWQRYYKHQLDCDGKQRTWEVDGVIYGHTDSDRYYSQGFNDGAKAQLKKISDKYELQSEAAIRVDQNKKIGDKLAEWRDDWDDEKSWDEMMVLIAKLQKGEDVE